MLATFEVSNFRSIKDTVELSFEAASYSDLEEYYVVKPNDKERLLKVGMIYGPNAAGKTNVLMALDFLRNLVAHPASKKDERIDYEPFAFHDVADKPNSSFRLVFFVAGIKYDYAVTLNNTHIVSEELYYHSPNRALVFKRTTDAPKELALLEWGSKKEVKIPASDQKILETNTLWNATVVGSYLKINIDQPQLKAVADWFGEQLWPMISPQTNLKGFLFERINSGKASKARMVDILQKAGLFITDFHIETHQIPISDDLRQLIASLPIKDEEKGQLESTKSLTKQDIKFEHRLLKDGEPRTFMLPYEEQSLGTKRLFDIAGIVDLLIQEPAIVPVDEIESSLHPDLIVQLLKMVLISVKKSQLLFTTHYRELLMERDLLRADTINFVERKSDGSTDLYSADDFSADVFRRKESSLYNTYKLGKLGATPFLTDAHID